MPHWYSGCADASKPSLDGFDSCMRHNEVNKKIKKSHYETTLVD